MEGWQRNGDDRWRNDAGAEVWFDGRPGHGVWRGTWVDPSGRSIPVSVAHDAETAMRRVDRALMG